MNERQINLNQYESIGDSHCGSNQPIAEFAKSPQKGDSHRGTSGDERWGERGQSPWFFRPEWGQSGDSHRVWSGGDHWGTVTVILRAENGDSHQGDRVGTVTECVETIGGQSPRDAGGQSMWFFAARPLGNGHVGLFFTPGARMGTVTRGSRGQRGDSHCSSLPRDHWTRPLARPLGDRHRSPSSREWGQSSSVEWECGVGTVTVVFTVVFSCFKLTDSPSRRVGAGTDTKRHSKRVRAGM
jgi:hypothetical protein